jgi:quercetin dioxygenase-like cupin family protein
VRYERGRGYRCGRWLNALAYRTNAISLIERGENSPTVSSLHLLAAAFKVPITAFFEEEQEESVVLVTPQQRLRSWANGITMESLGIGLRDQHLEPFLVTVEPGAGNIDEPVTHPGEEFVHCIKGEIEYCIGSQFYTLQADSSLLFAATQPHCFHNTAGVPALLMVVFQASDSDHVAQQRHMVSPPMHVGRVLRKDSEAGSG